MKKFAKKHLFTIIGVAVGAIAGFFYWKFIGCSTGSSAITPNPVNSTFTVQLWAGYCYQHLKIT